jgi:hypothetical protein
MRARACFKETGEAKVKGNGGVFTAACGDKDGVATGIASIDDVCPATLNQVSPPGAPGCPAPEGARHSIGKVPRDVSFPVPWFWIEAIPGSDWRWVAVSRSLNVVPDGPGIASQPVWVVQPGQGGELNIQMRRTAPNRPRGLSFLGKVCANHAVARRRV